VEEVKEVKEVEEVKEVKEVEEKERLDSGRLADRCCTGSLVIRQRNIV
jgi:hypothetical protein